MPTTVWTANTAMATVAMASTIMAITSMTGWAT
jgi:hypothetical protein